MIPTPNIEDNTRRLLETQAEYAALIERVNAELAVAQEAREAAIRAAHEAGLSLRVIAKIVGLSHVRIAQILNG